MSSADFLPIKSAVVDITKATLPDFTVTWAFLAKDPPKKWCYFGGLTFPEGENKTTRSREYTVMIPIVLNAIQPARMGNEAAETWLATQCSSLTAAFGASSTLRAAGVITWILAPRMFGSNPHTDGIEVQAVLELQVTYRVAPS